MSEVLKHLRHRGRTPDLSFYRDRKGREVDLLVNRGRDLVAVEIKSGRTPSPDALDAIAHFRHETRTRGRAKRAEHNLVVYAGDAHQSRTAGELLSWSEVDRVLWAE